MLFSNTMIILFLMKCGFLLFLFAFVITIVSAWNPFPQGEKSTWPELVGMKGEEAKEIVAKECKGCDVHIMGENSIMTMDLRVDRVRILVDGNDLVKVAPRRG